LARVQPTVGTERYRYYERAAELMRQLIQAERFMDFLTVPAYAQVMAAEAATEQSS
jgi:malate synthase